MRKKAMDANKLAKSADSICRKLASNFMTHGLAKAKGLAWGDLYSAGQLGILNALRNVDETRLGPGGFSSYATSYIRRAMLDEIWHPITSQAKRNLVRTVWNAQAKLFAQGVPHPEIEDIAAISGLPSDRIREGLDRIGMFGVLYPGIRFDQPIDYGDDELSLHEVISDHRSRQPLEMLEERESREATELAETIDEVEAKQILRALMGLGGEEREKIERYLADWERQSAPEKILPPRTVLRNYVYLVEVDSVLGRPDMKKLGPRRICKKIVRSGLGRRLSDLLLHKPQGEKEINSTSFVLLRHKWLAKYEQILEDC